MVRDRFCKVVDAAGAAVAPSLARPLGRAPGGGCERFLKQRGITLPGALAAGAAAVPERLETRNLGEFGFNQGMRRGVMASTDRPLVPPRPPAGFLECLWAVPEQ